VSRRSAAMRGREGGDPRSMKEGADVQGSWLTWLDWQVEVAGSGEGGAALLLLVTPLVVMVPVAVVDLCQ